MEASLRWTITSPPERLARSTALSTASFCRAKVPVARSARSRRTVQRPRSEITCQRLPSATTSAMASESLDCLACTFAEAILSPIFEAPAANT
jgi:hypothetical protein